VAEATVRPDHLLLRDGQLSAAAGIEYMAQAAAAWAGWQRHASAAPGGAARIGFLLGTRRYQCSRAAWRVDDVLRVRVQRLFQADNGLGQFECVITIAGTEVARASLNVFGPDDPEAFLNGQTP
jgi:predicted hotdog family 3-hydroxylacyl-ACP dehydratase